MNKLLSILLFTTIILFTSACDILGDSEEGPSTGLFLIYEFDPEETYISRLSSGDVTNKHVLIDCYDSSSISRAYYKYKDLSSLDDTYTEEELRCGIGSVISPLVENVFSISTISMTWEVIAYLEDEDGNTSSFTFTFDNEPADIDVNDSSTLNDVVEDDTTGEYTATITMADLNNTEVANSWNNLFAVEDNLDENAVISIDNVKGISEYVKTVGNDIELEVTYTDLAGNITTLIITITIVDSDIE